MDKVYHSGKSIIGFSICDSCFKEQLTFINFRVILYKWGKTALINIFDLRKSELRMITQLSYISCSTNSREE